MRSCRAALLLLLSGCPSSSPPAAPDLSAPTRGPAGPLEDCTPASDEGRCAEGLRCALVRLGEPPYEGTLAQCAPVPATPLPEDAPCSFADEAVGPAEGARKRLDRCAAGAGCVETPAGPRCRRLCALRVPGQCGKGRLCVLPSPVSSVGYCAAPDGCEAPPPQRGCPLGGDGQPLGCYVLTESKVDAADPPGGTFCLPQAPLGDSAGGLGDRCERSANCRPGLACALVPGELDPSCRPYCALPPADGGVPDGGVPCEGDLGTCRPIPYFEQTGRCY